MRTLAEIVPLRTQACREAVDAVSALAAGEGGADRRAVAHVMSCLRCQAEMAAYRRILVTMRAMRAEVLPPPPAGVGETLGSVHADLGHLDGPATWAVRAACVGGITASAAGVLVWYGRRRLGLAHAS